jgi:hypothetical protein
MVANLRKAVIMGKENPSRLVARQMRDYAAVGLRIQ